jgi:nucleotide-binding universal stress UspA family protein
MTDSNYMSQSIDPVADHSVLVAVDFSEDSKAALIWACRYAECSDAKLVLLHIVHDPATHPGFYHKAGKSLKASLQDIAETMMSDFISEVKAECPWMKVLDSAELRFVPGLPPTRIVEVSDLLNVDLIVVGSRGITGLPHILLGSVAERVVKLSSRPVVVVKGAGSPKLKKKHVKLLKKREKKDRKQLKSWLGLGQDEEDKGNVDG